MQDCRGLSCQGCRGQEVIRGGLEVIRGNQKVIRKDDEVMRGDGRRSGRDEEPWSSDQGRLPYPDPYPYPDPDPVGPRCD